MHLHRSVLRPHLGAGCACFGVTAALVCAALRPAAPLSAVPLSAVPLSAVPAGARGDEAAAPAIDYGRVRELMSDQKKTRRAAAKALLDAGDPALVPVVADALFFIPSEARDEALRVLERLTGERRGRRYLAWVEVVGARPDLGVPAGYREWKRSLLERIDPRYRSILPGDDAHADTVKLRLEEVVWGGVRVEGIPALESPPKVAAAEADVFMQAGDRVLGVSLEGRHHAYPVKVLSWHEMVNDTLAGRPHTLSYCTLCGSAVLYDTRRPDAEPLTFGTSGLLYRSNKLMLDRQTGSLWHNLGGEAVVGPMAAAGAVLEMLPVTLTTWSRWREAHPDTTVARPDPAFGSRFGFEYAEGAADARREGVSFPVWQKSARFDDKTEVLALLLDGRTKAYDLEALAAARVVNDSLGGMPLVVLVGADGGARAYRRGDRAFAPAGPDALGDQDGRSWTVTESALEPPAGSGLEPLDRLPSHVAFWFGWFGFYPDTEVFPEE
ncbi:MAG TPA: DUF3179 domain-containing protein [Thermoanaerobaculia bacterium]|nr:DUF3179 domain-containing protein [Thermoanaerobaculia bacterium]